MLENHILDEDKDVEEIQKYLGQVRIAQRSANSDKTMPAVARRR
jgi:hypothetical protein